MKGLKGRRSGGNKRWIDWASKRPREGRKIGRCKYWAGKGTDSSEKGRKRNLERPNKFLEPELGDGS